jgi:hypothetical protein
MSRVALPTFDIQKDPHFIYSERRLPYLLDFRATVAAQLDGSLFRYILLEIVTYTATTPPLRRTAAAFHDCRYLHLRWVLISILRH